MTFDSSVPEKLKTIQQWFGSIISRPIDSENKIIPITPLGNPIEKEAAQFITPSPTLKPFQRIELYNQQYWWRLLSCLHESFPCVVRLFGYRGFNEQIGFPYLVKYPPNHWSLNTLGDRLPKWVEEEYKKKDKNLVLDSSKIDEAYNEIFLSPCKASLSEQSIDPETLFSSIITLQPHVRLFTFDYELFPFRDALLKEEPEYWEENDFPELEKTGKSYFLCYQHPNKSVAWEKIDHAEYALLSRLQTPCSLESAIEWIETDPKLEEEASEHLHQWLQKWIIYRWI